MFSSLGPKRLSDYKKFSGSLNFDLEASGLKLTTYFYDQTIELYMLGPKARVKPALVHCSVDLELSTIELLMSLTS